MLFSPIYNANSSTPGNKRKIDDVIINMNQALHSISQKKAKIQGTIPSFDPKDVLTNEELNNLSQFINNSDAAKSNNNSNSNSQESGENQVKSPQTHVLTLTTDSNSIQLKDTNDVNQNVDTESALILT